MADPEILTRYLYENFVAPQFMRQRSALQGHTLEVGQFWAAIKVWCAWFCDIVRVGIEAKQLGYDSTRGQWLNAQNLVDPERSLTYAMSHPDWSAPILIVGSASTVLRKPLTGDWCILESLFEPAHRSVLYHAMLTKHGRQLGSVTSIRCHPVLRETVHSSSEMDDSMKKLIPLIADIAGVLPGADDHRAVKLARLALLPGEPVAPSKTADDLALSRIAEVCGEFGADVTHAGPSVRAAASYRYLVDPGPHSPPNKISSLALDLQVRLGLDLSPMIRIEKNRVVIEVARNDRKEVLFQHVRNQLPRTDASSRVPVGVNHLGSLKFADLAVSGTAHIVVAGSAGSGKTQWLRMALAGLALQNTSRSLRYVFLDSSGPTLVGTDDKSRDSEAALSHLSPSVPLRLLDGLIREMDSRRRVMTSEGVEDWSQLAPKHRLAWPRIVCACDEYADLAQPKRNFPELDSRILTLAAHGCAAGIHLILASRRINSESMQTFSRQPAFCKVVLRVPTPRDSRQWLGIPGAENLLGQGDLFFQNSVSPWRLQAPLMSPGESLEGLASAPGVLCA